jgi:hypothetical protein
MQIPRFYDPYRVADLYLEPWWPTKPWLPAAQAC